MLVCWTISLRRTFEGSWKWLTVSIGLEKRFLSCGSVKYGNTEASAQVVFLPFRTSLQYGISCLKRVNYDKKELERRRENSNNDNKGDETGRIKINGEHRNTASLCVCAFTACQSVHLCFHSLPVCAFTGCQSVHLQPVRLCVCGFTACQWPFCAVRSTARLQSCKAFPTPMGVCPLLLYLPVNS